MSAAPAVRAGSSNRWFVLSAVVLGNFATFLVGTALNTALPRIIQVFGVAVDEGQLVLSTYLVAQAVMVPLVAYITNTVGLRRAFLTTLSLFTFSTMLCALAWNLESLVFFRVLQGLAGGMTFPLGMTIIFTTVPPEDRGYVMGYLGIPQMFIPAIGPSVGGFLVEFADWRWVFFINIPFAIGGLIVAWFVLPDNGVRRKVPFDFPGFLLAALWLSTGLIAISRGSADGWGSVQIRLMLSVASVAFALWVIRQLTAQHPLLDLRLFRLPEFAVSVSVTSLITATLFGGIFLMPLFLQNLQGMSPMQTGLLLLPQAFASAVVQPVSGRLFDRFGPRPLIVAGLAVMGWTQYQLSFIDLNTSYLHLQLLFIVRGMAMGLIAMPSNTAAMNAAPMVKAADASSLVNMARQVFSAIGTAGFGTLLASRQTFHYAMVSRHITPFDPGVVGYLASYQAEALHNGASETAARIGAAMSVARHARDAAGVMAFDDAFLVAGMLCFLGIIPTLFMKNTVVRRPPGGPSGPPSPRPAGPARPAG